jgi:hypothetical protein
VVGGGGKGLDEGLLMRWRSTAGRVRQAAGCVPSRLSSMISSKQTVGPGCISPHHARRPRHGLILARRKMNLESPA